MYSATTNVNRTFCPLNLLSSILPQPHVIATRMSWLVQWHLDRK